jgi:hypothetical protein
MTSNKGDAKPFFNGAAHSYSHEPDKKRGSTMITQERPAPRPIPPAWGHAVDEALFRQRWQQEMQTAQAPDPFNAVNRQSQAKSLRDNFNIRSDEMHAAKHHLLNRDDQLAEAIDIYLQAYEAGQPIPDRLRDHIERLNIETLQAEAQVNAYQNNGKALEKPMHLGDAFDKADRQAQQRGQGVSRGRS